MDAVQRSTLIYSNASRVPGYIVNLGFELVDEIPSEYEPTTTYGLGTGGIMQALTSVPYFYGQRNFSTKGLPTGFSDK